MRTPTDYNTTKKKKSDGPQNERLNSGTCQERKTTTNKKKVGGEIEKRGRGKQAMAKQQHRTNTKIGKE